MKFIFFLLIATILSEYFAPFFKPFCDLTNGFARIVTIVALLIFLFFVFKFKFPRIRKLAPIGKFLRMRNHLRCANFDFLCEFFTGIQAHYFYVRNYLTKFFRQFVDSNFCFWYVEFCYWYAVISNGRVFFNPRAWILF